MNITNEILYKTFQVFDGKNHPFITSKLSLEWCKKQLTEFVNAAEPEKLISHFFEMGYIEFPLPNTIKLSAVGRQYFDNYFFNNQVYEIIDTFLLKLKNTNGGKGSFDANIRNHRIQQEVENILEENLLVKYMLPYQKELSMIEIMANGYKAIDAGGIENYLKRLTVDENKKSLSDNRKTEYHFHNDVENFIKDSFNNNKGEISQSFESERDFVKIEPTIPQSITPTNTQKAFWTKTWKSIKNFSKNVWDNIITKIIVGVATAYLIYKFGIKG
jgi:hypothetical protein